MRRKNENRRDKLETLKNVDVVKVVNDEDAIAAQKNEAIEKGPRKTEE